MTPLSRLWVVTVLLTLVPGNDKQAGEPQPEGPVTRLSVSPMTGRGLSAGPVFCVTFSPDGQTVVTAGNLGGVCLWDAATGQFREALPARGSIRQVVFSADGRYLAALANEGEMSVWDLPNDRQSVYRGSASLRTASVLSFAPTGSAFVWGDEQGGIYFWDLHRQRLVRGLSATGAEGISLLRFGPGAESLLLVSRKGQIERHDLLAGKLFGSVDVHEANHRMLHLSPSGRLLVLPGIRREVRVRETATGQETELIPDREAFVTAVRFSPDGRLLALAVRVGIQLWNLERGEEIARYWGHTQPITGLDFAPDGRSLASTSKDGTALLWRVPTLASSPAATRTEEEVKALWRDLASPEAPQAYRAMRSLAQTPVQAIALLEGHLKPLPEEARTRLRLLLRQLRDDVVAHREQATTGLLEWGDRIHPAVLQELRQSPPVEARRGLERVVESWRSRPITAEELRGQRALTLLEWLEPAQSRKLLDLLAAGPAEDMLTQEARGLLQRQRP